MSKFRINTTKSIPSDEFIRQNMPPFEKITASVKPAPKSINKLWQWAGGSAVVVAGVVSIYLITSGVSNDHTPVVLSDDSTRCVHAPVADIDIPAGHYSFKNEDGATLLTPEGTRIIVPENTFLKPDGLPVKGPVDLQFREFHNVADFFRSGIPMTYDSAGTEYTFESAGMFELLAMAGGEQLQVAPGKEILVDLVSQTSDAKHNVYYLDTVSKKWDYIAESTFKPLDEQEQQRQANPDFTYAFNPDETRSDFTLTQSFIKPVQASKQSYVFKAQYDRNLFPELSIYNDVLFEVDETRQSFSPELYKVNWSSVSIKRSKMDGLYMLKMSRPDTTVKVYARPVFSAETYQQAMANYKKQTSSDDQARALYRNRTDSAVSVRNNIISTQQASFVGYRRVGVTRTGIFNCDYPIRVDNESIQPTFTENGLAFTPARIYWSDVSVNAMYEARGNTAEIRFTKGAPIVMWVVDDQERIAVISKAEFARKVKKSNKPVFDVSFSEARDGLEKLNTELFDGNPSNTGNTMSSQITTGTQPSISCYPNPASTQMNVRIEGNQGWQNSSLMILNNTGQVVKTFIPGATSETIDINVNDLAPGIYFIQLSTMSGTSVNQRFIKQ